MIIAVSIVDKHQPKGKLHVGTYMFEIDCPAGSHFDLLAAVCLPEQESHLRSKLGRLVTKNEMLQEPEQWETGDGRPITVPPVKQPAGKRVPEVFGSNVSDVCPACGNVSLPRFRGCATAVACQAPGCEHVVEKNGAGR